jgi:SAM-dependent methyltransferase
MPELMRASTKLNLGCGTKAKKGWVNLDIARLPGVDVVHDLESTPLPFADDRFDLVETHHVLEHIDRFIPLMEELHRTCKPGARLEIAVPYFASPAFWLDPTHKRKFNIDTFATAFTGDNHLSSARFRIVKRKLFYLSCKRFMESSWYSSPIDMAINIFPRVYERFFVYLLPASELHLILIVEKGQKKRKKIPA